MPPKKKAKRKPGRPRKELDYKQIKKLLSIGCTMNEVGSVIGMTPQNMWDRAKKDRELFEAIETGRSTCKESLRRMQWNLAKKGNCKMLIFLGKNLLGQSENPEFYDVEEETPVETPRVTMTVQNPIGSSSRVSLSLPSDADVTLSLYDVTGRQIRTLSDHYEAGTHTIRLDVSSLSSGVYLLNLDAGDQQMTKKLILSK